VRQSVRERILQNIEAALRTIVEGDVYNFTVRQVERTRVTPLLENLEFPALFIFEMPERLTQGPNPLMTKELVIVIQAWIRSGDDDLSVQVNGLLADLEVALLADKTRGGLAVDTLFSEHSIYLDTPIDVLAATHTIFTVHYRTVEGDPYTVS